MSVQLRIKVSSTLSTSTILTNTCHYTHMKEGLDLAGHVIRKTCSSQIQYIPMTTKITTNTETAMLSTCDVYPQAPSNIQSVLMDGSWYSFKTTQASRTYLDLRTCLSMFYKLQRMVRRKIGEEEEHVEHRIALPIG